MSLFNDLAEARAEYLQQKWDRFLVDCWCDTPAHIVGGKCNQFCEMAGISDDEFYTLLRGPSETYQRAESVQRFVAAHLPRISAYFFDHPKIISDMSLRAVGAAKIGASKIKTLSSQSDAVKKKAEAKEILKDKKRMIGVAISCAINTKRRLGMQRGAWDVCK